MHFHLDFTALGIDSLRQLWWTFAPALNYGSGSSNPALVPYQASEWSAVFSNWTLADPNGVLPLKVAGPGSVVVSSRDSWSTYSGTAWAEQTGFYFHGFARFSAHAGDFVTIRYACQHTHDLYLGTVLASGYGTLHVTLDGVSRPTSIAAST